ncbi:MAG: hypothetical protein IKC75_08090 [Clostridia bacterium]|nr:hypothetical protein [Clostridia bacterium]
MLRAGEKNFDAKLWFSEDRAVLTSDALLGSTTLGVDFNTLKNDISHSIFINGSGTAYAEEKINESTAAAILTWVDGFYTLFGALEDTPDMLDKYVEIFLKNLTEYAGISRYSEKGKVKVYLSVDNTMLSRALRDTWATAVKDKTLVRRAREVARTRDAMQSALSGVVYSEWTNKVEAWLANSAEIEALCAKIDAADPFTFELNATVKKLTGKLLYLDLTHRSGEDATAFSIDLSAKDHLELSFLVEGVKHSLSVAVEKDSWRTFTADYTYHRALGDAAPKTVSGRFDLLKKEDTYTLTLGKNGAVKTVSGRFSCENDAFVFAIDSVKSGDASVDFKFSLSMKEKAEMAPAPHYVNLVTVTEQRIAPVAERAKAAKATFLEAVELDAFTTEGIFAYLIAPLSFES